MFVAFKILWDRRNQEHIEVVEIEAYARMNSVDDMEQFLQLIIVADSCVRETLIKIAEEKKRFKEMFAGLKKSQTH